VCQHLKQHASIGEIATHHQLFKQLPHRSNKSYVWARKVWFEKRSQYRLIARHVATRHNFFLALRFRELRVLKRLTKTLRTQWRPSLGGAGKYGCQFERSYESPMARTAQAGAEHG
jgi:hypothetical protein